MGIFRSLFSSESVIEKTIDAVYSAGDKLIYTDEEKADMAIKRSNLHIRFLNAYEPFKIAQRFLALIVGIPYMFFVSVSGLVYLAGLAIPPDLVEDAYIPSQYGTYLMEGSIKFITILSGAIGGYFGLIMGFYFDGGMIEGGIRAFTKGK